MRVPILVDESTDWVGLHTILTLSYCTIGNSS
jgi:hypothetical protein